MAMLLPVASTLATWLHTPAMLGTSWLVRPHKHAGYMDSGQAQHPSARVSHYGGPKVCVYVCMHVYVCMCVCVWRVMVWMALSLWLGPHLGSKAFYKCSTGFDMVLVLLIKDVAWSGDVPLY